MRVFGYFLHEQKVTPRREEGGHPLYLHLGQNVMVNNQDIIGVFDLDNTTWSFRTRRFLERAEQEGRVITVGDDLPRSFVLTQEGDGPPRAYITALSSAALCARAERSGFE